MTVTPMLRLYLWSHRVLYLGHSPDNERHQHHAAQICVSLDGQLRVDDDQNEIQARGILIPPDHPHRIRAGNNRLLALYVEPEGSEFEALIAPLLAVGPSTCLVPLSVSPPQRIALETLYENGNDANRAWSVCVAALGLGASATRTNAHDVRIEQVIDIIRANPGGPHPVDRLAQAVNISASRLSHLFCEQVGIPIRRFTVWSRIRQVILLAVDGATLTDAAHAAGFSDAAHMSNVFRQMFGFAPSKLFARHIHKAVQVLD